MTFGCVLGVCFSKLFTCFESLLLKGLLNDDTSILGVPRKENNIQIPMFNQVALNVF